MPTVHPTPTRARRSLPWLPLLALMLLASCDSGAGEEPQAPAIAFSPGEEAPGSGRASASALESQYNSFAVKAWKTDADGHTQLVMGSPDDSSVAYRVEYLYGWYYTGLADQQLKYWDPSATGYDFVAVAPCSDTGAIDFPGIDPAPLPLITGVKAGAAATATDWAVAALRRSPDGTGRWQDTDRYDSDAPIGAARTAVTSEVPLVFHHIMSLLEFRIYSSEGSAFSVERFEATLSQEICSCADYRAAPDWQAASCWTPQPGALSATLVAAADASTGDIAASDRASAALLGASVAIPQALGTATEPLMLNMDIDIEGSTRSVTANLTTAAGAFKGGTRYIFYLVYDPSDDIILVYVASAPWLYGDSMPESTQTDW